MAAHRLVATPSAPWTRQYIVPTTAGFLHGSSFFVQPLQTLPDDGKKEQIYFSTWLVSLRKTNLLVALKKIS
jgi:hypothetical protein